MIVELRERLGAANGKKTASREATAKYLRCSVGTVFNWERGLVAPPKAAVDRLVAALNGVKSGASETVSNVGGVVRYLGKKDAHERLLARESKPVTRAAAKFAIMAQAIGVCGSIDSARQTFEHAAKALTS